MSLPAQQKSLEAGPPGFFTCFRFQERTAGSFGHWLQRGHIFGLNAKRDERGLRLRCQRFV